MGAERWLEFATAEDARRARAYLEDRIDIWSDELRIGCWVEWRNKPSKVLEIAHSAGAGNDDLGTLVCREMARRFPIKRIGADAIGWYDDTEWAPSDDPRSPCNRYGPYKRWAEWLPDYKMAWSFNHDWYTEDELIKLEAFVKGYFEALDQKARA